MVYDGKMYGLAADVDMFCRTVVRGVKVILWRDAPGRSVGVPSAETAFCIQ